MSEDRQTLQCEHLRDGTLPMHSGLCWKTTPPEVNQTDHAWDLDIMLCTFCSGKLRGLIDGRLPLFETEREP